MLNFNTPVKLLLAALLLAASLFTASAQVAVLKAEFYNHQLWIKAGLKNGGPDTLNFIFDSGASTSLLDSAVVARAFPGRKLGQSMARGAAGVTAMQRLTNEALYTGSLKLDGISFLVNNLGRLSGNTGRRLDGIIGYDILRKYVVRLDIDAQTIALYQKIEDVKQDKGNPLEFDFSPDISFLPRVKCSFTTQEGKAYSGNFFFDSGAGLTCILNTPFVNDNNLLTSAGPVITLRSDGLTNAADRYVARARDLSFGGYAFKDVPLSMSQTTAGVNAMKDYAGILGNEILYKYNITFDYAHKAIYMQPNHYHDDTFEFPLAAFAFKSDQGGVYIWTVSANSPEATLGLKQGDRLISINGQTGLGLTRAREFLKHPGNIKLKVRQENADKEFDIRLYPRI